MGAALFTFARGLTIKKAHLDFLIKVISYGLVKVLRGSCHIHVNDNLFSKKTFGYVKYCIEIFYYLTFGSVLR